MVQEEEEAQEEEEEEEERNCLSRGRRMFGTWPVHRRRRKLSFPICVESEERRR